MFVRSVHNLAPEEIEMKELKHQVDLKGISFTNFISSPEIRIFVKIPSITAELKRTPRKTYINHEPKNETESLVSRIADVIWVKTFAYLDLKTLAIMMISCKKMACLANDSKIRERLYQSKQNSFFKSLLTVPRLEIKSEPARLFQQDLFVPQVPVIPHQDLQVYQVHNDNPPGRGFVMR